MIKGLPIKNIADESTDVVMTYDSESNEIQLSNGSWDAADKWEVDDDTTAALIEYFIAELP